MRELHRLAVRQTANGRLLLSGALLVGAGASLASCDAATLFTVNSTSDEGEDSLRAAVTRANQISASGVSGIVIELQAGTYELTRCAADDDNASGDLDLTTNMAVYSARALTIHGESYTGNINRTHPGLPYYVSFPQPGQGPPPTTRSCGQVGASLMGDAGVTVEDADTSGNINECAGL